MERKIKQKVTATPILKDKFWIIENESTRLGTLTADEDQYMYNCTTGVKWFKDKRHLKQELGNILWADIQNDCNTSKEVHGYPTSTVPFNPLFDVKRKLPLFTKSCKSKSLYCAGYYIIRFDKGWVKSFCPKLITIERYSYYGPFKTEIEMKQKLSIENAK